MVTFIIPAYNASKYIEKAVTSLQRQSIDEWRLIAIDDCSTDNTLAILQRFAAEDSRISVIARSQNSGGVLIPRRQGIEAADTEWVAPLDADDWVDPDYLQRLIDKQQSTKAEAVYPVMYAVPGGKRLVPDRDFTRGPAVSGDEAILLTLPLYKIGLGGGLVKRDAYLKTFIDSDNTFSTGDVFQDEGLTRILLSNLNSVAFAETAYFYRQHPASISHAAFDKLFFPFFRMQEELLSFFRIRYGEDSKQYRALELYIFNSIIDKRRDMRKIKLSLSTRLGLYKRLREMRRLISLRHIRQSGTHPGYLLYMLF